MKQILEIVETGKELSAYKRRLNFLRKQVYDNKRAMDRTTDGNSYSRYKADKKYWEEELAIFTLARDIVFADQNDYIELVADLEDGKIEEECYVCDGLGFTHVIKQNRYDNPYPDCKECNGTGKVGGVCRKCNGAKQITVMQGDEALDVVDCECMGYV